eukprot:Hpha_TRINITY_DN15327_c3_g1::TRINITY_DN15327_c3_g1_i2::g.91051::m.91051
MEETAPLLRSQGPSPTSRRMVGAFLVSAAVLAAVGTVGGMERSGGLASVKQGLKNWEHWAEALNAGGGLSVEYGSKILAEDALWDMEFIPRPVSLRGVPEFMAGVAGLSY